MEVAKSMVDVAPGTAQATAPDKRYGSFVKVFKTLNHMCSTCVFSVRLGNRYPREYNGTLRRIDENGQVIYLLGTGLPSGQPASDLVIREDFMDTTQELTDTHGYLQDRLRNNRGFEPFDRSMMTKPLRDRLYPKLAADLLRQMDCENVSEFLFAAFFTEVGYSRWQDIDDTLLSEERNAMALFMQRPKRRVTSLLELSLIHI